MNKQRFFEILEYELGNLSGDVKSEIINDFREHFDIAQSSGKTEEEICTILGDPKEIAKEFISETPATNRYFENNDEVFEDKDVFEKEPSESNENTKYYGTNIKSQKSESVPAPIETLITQISANKVRKIKFELLSSDLNVEGIDTDFITVDIEDEDKNRFLTEISSDGVFLFKEKSKYSSSFFSKLIRNDGTEISLTLPESFSGIMEIVMNSGDLEVDKLGEIKQFKAKTGSGDVSLEKINCGEDLSVFSGSGDISIKNIRGNKAIVKSGSGDIDINMASVMSFAISTGSGDIEINSCISLEAFNISTGSGDIESKNSKGNLRVSTGSGEISVLSHEGSVGASTGSGDIEIDTDSITSNVTYSTGSGDIDIKCNRLTADLRATTGTGDVNLKIKEVVGNIKAKTATGDIQVDIGENSNVKFNLITGRNGSKSNEFEKLDAKTNKNREAAIYTVTLETNFGDIDVNAI